MPLDSGERFMTIGSEMVVSQGYQPLGGVSRRYIEFDIMRGYALLAMLIAHSAWRIPDLDYRAAYGWDNLFVPDLTTPQGILGWLLQGSSPVFFMLAGFALAFFIVSRYRRGWSEGTMTRFLIVRGLMLIVLDLTLMNLDTEPLAYGYRLSVLTAMGINLCLLAVLLRLNWRCLAVIALVILAGTQSYYYFHGRPQGDSLLRAVLLAPGGSETWLVLFPALPWLPVMIFGYLSGRYLLHGTTRLKHYTLIAGCGLLLAGTVIILLNGPGNLYPENPLIFGKHPPDLAFLTIYPGLALLLVYMHHRFPILNTTTIMRVVAIFGQTSLFFYLVHVRVLMLVSYVVVDWMLPPLAHSLALVSITVPIMFVLCSWYFSVRARYPESVLKYL